MQNLSSLADMTLGVTHAPGKMDDTPIRVHGNNGTRWMESNCSNSTTKEDFTDSTQMYILMAMLVVFAVVGAFGNTFVLYGFSKMIRQNLTSTVFILTLAGTDLITAVLIIPYTVYMEFVAFYVDTDPICKLYHFLITSTVPYSIFMMVAIAFDRYLCICRPFKHSMNLKRAQFVVVFFAVVAVLLGATISLFYGVYARPEVKQSNVLNETEQFSIIDGNSGLDDTGEKDTDYHTDFEEIVNFSIATVYVVTTEFTTSETSPIFTGLCDRNDLIFPDNFQRAVQLCYSMLFLFAVIVVAILYTCIFVVVTNRRNKTKKIRSTNSIVHNGKYNSTNRRESTFSQLTQRKRRSSNQESMRGSSRRSERAFVANLRTALTLFIVTVVFIVVFLPGWLMALRVVRLDMFLYYLHLIHCVVNPFIYAFMNESFRRVLKKLFSCKPMGSTLAIVRGASQTTC